MMKSYPNPWSIQIETVEGCNRRCRFCGIHSLYREKKDMMYKFMTVETADLISKQLGQWLKKIRIEFALQGEPLLNPDIISILNKFKTNFPMSQLMMTSNTDVLRKGKIDFDEIKLLKLFLAGLNIYVADYYGEKTDPTYQEFFNGLTLAGQKIGVPVYDFYKEKPKVWAYESNTSSKIVVIDNTIDRNLQRSLNNQAGNTNPNYFPELNFKKRIKSRINKRCPLPFREMAIKYDGSIALCCMDWQRENLIGKITEQNTIKDIWLGMQFNRVRKLLFNGRRDLIVPCTRCDRIGIKSGLITDVDLEGGQTDLIQISKDLRKEQMENMKKYGANRYALKPFIYQQ